MPTTALVLVLAGCQTLSPCEGPAWTCDISGADALLLAEGTGNQAGFAVAGGSDHDGDGAPDLLVGATLATASGSAYAVRGGVLGEVGLGESPLVMTGEAGSNVGGSVAAVGDVDGDGVDDLMVGAIALDTDRDRAGAAYLVAGGTTGAVDLTTMAVARVPGWDEEQRVGCAMASAGDRDGDGAGDVWVAGKGDDNGGDGAGGVWLFRGPLAGDQDVLAAPTFLQGQAPDHGTGTALTNPGDVDGDGFDDLLVGAPGVGGLPGRAFLQYSHPEGTFSLADAEGRMLGLDYDDDTGAAVTGLGDINLDGYDDVAVGAPAETTNGERAGAVWVFFGPVSDRASVAEAVGKVYGAAADDQAGSSVAGPGDLNGDSQNDLVVGALGASGNGRDAGALFLVLGPLEGRRDLGNEADAVVGGFGNLSGLGTSLTPVGDVNGDGLGDILAGAPNAAGFLDGGVAALLLGSTAL